MPPKNFGRPQSPLSGYVPALLQQQYLFAIAGWKPQERQPINAGTKKKYKINTMYKTRRMAIAN